MIQQSILKSFEDRKVLVTGGTGLIGRQIVTMLCDASAEVTIVSLDEVRADKRAKHIKGDLTSFEFCLKTTKKMEFVFHLAGVKGSAQVSTTKLASHFVPTLMMNTNVLEACKRNKAEKTVYTSSIGAYADAEIFRELDYKLDSLPMDFAGWSKRIAELQIHAYHIQYGLDNFSIVRPCNVYGPGDNFDPENAMVIPTLMYKIKRGDNPVKIWGDGSAIRDFAYSRDVAEGIILALYYGTKSQFVNLGSGKGYSVRELVETLSSFIDFKYEFDTTKPTGYPKRIMDISLARKLIHYNPTTTLKEGLKQTWEWFLNNRDEYLHKKNYFIEEKI